MIKIMFKSDYEDMVHEIEDLDRELNDLEKELRTKDSMLAKRNKEIEDLKKDSSAKDSIISRKEQEIKKKEQDYNGLETLKNKEIQRLSDRVNELKKSNDVLKAAKGGLTSNNHKLETQNMELVSEVNNLRKELEDAYNKLGVQANKIKEFSKAQVHTIDEYKQNGLPKRAKRKNKK